MNKHFYLTNGKIGGVCGGIANYFDCDVTIVRLLTVLLVFGFGVSVIPYFLIWMLAPDD